MLRASRRESARSAAFEVYGTLPDAQSRIITASHSVHCTTPRLQYHRLCTMLPTVFPCEKETRLVMLRDSD